MFIVMGLMIVGAGLTVGIIYWKIEKTIKRYDESAKTVRAKK